MFIRIIGSGMSVRVEGGGWFRCVIRSRKSECTTDDECVVDDVKVRWMVSEGLSVVWVCASKCQARLPIVVMHHARACVCMTCVCAHYVVLA